MNDATVMDRIIRMIQTDLAGFCQDCGGLPRQSIRLKCRLMAYPGGTQAGFIMFVQGDYHQYGEYHIYKAMPVMLDIPKDVPGQGDA